jgi:hypothetical protein
MLQTVFFVSAGARVLHVAKTAYTVIFSPFSAGGQPETTAIIRLSV